ncbi:MAG: class I SAM-dependent methyltransferase [Chthoniobacteraceae bacterium]
MSIITTQTADRLRAIWSTRPIPPLSYATVREYCEYSDVCPELFGGCQDLKDAQRPWMIKAVLATVPPGASLVEIGGGQPTVAQALVDLGYRVTVVDPYDGSGNGPVEYDRYRREYPQVRLVRSQFTKDCPFAEGSFDGVYSVSVIEHIPLEALAGLFAAMKKFVRPGGASIHCIDVVLRGWTADHHRKPAQEVIRLQQILTALAEPAELGDFDCLAARMEADVETFLLSPYGHNMWRNGVPYEQYPFRRVASVQVCGKLVSFR